MRPTRPAAATTSRSSCSGSRRSGAEASDRAADDHRRTGRGGDARSAPRLPVAPKPSADPARPTSRAGRARLARTQGRKPTGAAVSPAQLGVSERRSRRRRSIAIVTRAVPGRRRRLPRDPPAVLPRHQLPGDRDDLSRAPVRPAVGHPAVRDVLRVRRSRLARPGRPPRKASSTTICARRRARRTWSTSSSSARWLSEGAQPRADRADPRVAARHGRVRGRVHPALEQALERVADLRRDLPRAVRRRPHLHPDHAAVRRPVHVPAGRGAGQLRDRDDLPDLGDRRAPAGAVVRARPGPVRRHDRARSGTTASSSTTAT